jgi:hypothetical protein
VFARGLIRGRDDPAADANGATVLFLALGEAGALDVMAGPDIVLLIGLSDNLQMTPAERAAAMLPLCRAALYTGHGRVPFLLYLARMLHEAMPSVHAMRCETRDPEDFAAALRDQVVECAARTPDAWLIFRRTLERAYHTSRS